MGDLGRIAVMIFVLPGMGADGGMFPGPWRDLPECVFVSWPKYAGEKTIGQIAARVIAEEKIPEGATLIGSSLGGIVACEIAHQRRASQLILVGSAKSKDEINSLLKVLHPLADVAPIEFIQLATGKLPGELTQMFRRSEPAFIRAMCRAIFTWDGIDASCVKPRRIHGRKDHVIPPPAVAEQFLDGGHLIAMTHADECVTFVRSVLAS